MDIFKFQNFFHMSRQLQIVKLVKLTSEVFFAFMHSHCSVSDIGGVVKVVDSHLCGWSSIPGKSCSFYKVLCVCYAIHTRCSKYTV